MKDFYVDLFSNASTDVYQDNTLSHFRNKLYNALDLEDHMEVSLCELSFVDSVNNIPHTDSATFKIFDFLYEIKNDDNSPTQYYGKMYEFTLEPGFYDSPQKLVDYINQSVWEKVTRLKNIPIFKYNQVTGHILFYYPDENFFTFFLLKEMLVLMGVFHHSKGVPQKQVIMGSTKPALEYRYHDELRKFADKRQYISMVPRSDSFQYPCSLDYLDSIYCYTDIIHEVITGDKKTSLLRIASIKRDPNNRITICYENPHYIPLRVRHITDIRIELRDSKGSFILFTSGRYTRVKLHFKKREQF